MSTTSRWHETGRQLARERGWCRAIAQPSCQAIVNRRASVQDDTDDDHDDHDDRSHLLAALAML
eukprot:3627570-Rhodomonas_salina.4